MSTYTCIKQTDNREEENREMEHLCHCPADDCTRHPPALTPIAIGSAFHCQRSKQHRETQSNMNDDEYIDSLSPLSSSSYWWPTAFKIEKKRRTKGCGGRGSRAFHAELLPSCCWSRGSESRRPCPQRPRSRTSQRRNLFSNKSKKKKNKINIQIFERDHRRRHTRSKGKTAQSDLNSSQLSRFLIDAQREDSPVETLINWITTRLGDGRGWNIALSLMTQKVAGNHQVSRCRRKKQTQKVLGSTFGGGTITLDRFFGGASRRRRRRCLRQGKRESPHQTSTISKTPPFSSFLFFFYFSRRKWRRKKVNFRNGPSFVWSLSLVTRYNIFGVSLQEREKKNDVRGGPR